MGSWNEGVPFVATDYLTELDMPTGGAPEWFTRVGMELEWPLPPEG
jgi:hypothetical protein